MKKPRPLRLDIALASLFVVTLLLTNCSISKNATAVKKDASDPNLIQPTEAESTTVTWSSSLRKVPGLDVRGSEPNLSLRIRGEKSMSQSNEPLYILEGVPLGHNFSSLARVIMPKDVASIRVLKGAAAAIYGSRAANGVVVVKQKE